VKPFVWRCPADGERVADVEQGHDGRIFWVPRLPRTPDERGYFDSRSAEREFMRDGIDDYFDDIDKPLRVLKPAASDPGNGADLPGWCPRCGAVSVPFEEVRTPDP
jgi:hypothetical protein